MAGVGTDDFFVGAGRIRFLELIRAPFWGKPGTAAAELEQVRGTGRSVLLFRSPWVVDQRKDLPEPPTEEPEPLLEKLRPLIPRLSQVFKELDEVAELLLQTPVERRFLRARTMPKIRDALAAWCDRWNFSAPWMRDVAYSTALRWAEPEPEPDPKRGWQEKPEERRRRRAWDDEINIYGGKVERFVGPVRAPRETFPSFRERSLVEHGRWLEAQEHGDRAKATTAHPTDAYVRLIRFNVLGDPVRQLIGPLDDDKAVRRSCANLADFLGIPLRTQDR